MVRAYLKKEGATLHHGVRKHNVQLKTRRIWCFWLSVGMWNIGSLSEMVKESRVELINRMFGVCLHEVR